MTYQVLLFYKYVHIDDPEALRQRLLDLCAKHNMLGRGLVAEEGLNMTAEGLVEDTEKFVVELKEDPRFSDISIKRSEGTGDAFPKLSVKVRNEIVGTRFPKEIDPTKQTGTYLRQTS